MENIALFLFDPPTQNTLYIHIYTYIKTHGSESRGQGGSTLRRPLDERT